MVTVRIQRKRRRKAKRVIAPSMLAVIVFAIVAIITAQAITYIWLATMIAGLPLAYWLGYRRNREEIARLNYIIRTNKEIISLEQSGEIPAPNLSGKLPANIKPGRVSRSRLLNDPRSGANPL